MEQRNLTDFEDFMNKIVKFLTLNDDKLTEEILANFED